MGMFDSVYMDFKCPVCRETSIIDFQTKQGLKGLHKYLIGDTFPFNSKNKKKKVINTIGCCDSMECKVAAAKNCLKEYGYVSGLSRQIQADICLDENGKILNRVNVLRYDDYSVDDEEWFDRLNIDQLFIFESIFNITQSQHIAILLMHPFSQQTFWAMVEWLKERGLDDEEIKSVFHSNEYTKIKEVLR